MTRLFVDSNIFLYATGSEHPYRQPCQRTLAGLRENDSVVAESNVDVVQEVAHVRFRNTGSRSDALAAAKIVRELCDLHATLPEDLEDALRLYADVGDLSARDAFYAAAALRSGVSSFLSTDRDFDRVPGLTRIDPAEFLSEFS